MIKPIEIDKSKVQTLRGEVVSNKMDKTIAVRIQRKIRHPLYKKYVKRITKILAHDEENKTGEGDIVEIAQCRPISKNKAWILVNVVEKAKI